MDSGKTPMQQVLGDIFREWGSGVMGLYQQAQNNLAQRFPKSKDENGG